MCLWVCLQTSSCSSTSSTSRKIYDRKNLINEHLWDAAQNWKRKWCLRINFHFSSDVFRWLSTRETFYKLVRKENKCKKMKDVQTTTLHFSVKRREKKLFIVKSKIKVKQVIKLTINNLKIINKRTTPVSWESSRMEIFILFFFSRRSRLMMKRLVFKLKRKVISSNLEGSIFWGFQGFETNERLHNFDYSRDKFQQFSFIFIIFL